MVGLEQHAILRAMMERFSISSISPRNGYIFFSNLTFVMFGEICLYTSTSCVTSWPCFYALKIVKKRWDQFSSEIAETRFSVSCSLHLIRIHLLVLFLLFCSFPVSFFFQIFSKPPYEHILILHCLWCAQKKARSTLSETSETRLLVSSPLHLIWTRLIVLFFCYFFFVLFRFPFSISLFPFFSFKPPYEHILTLHCLWCTQKKVRSTFPRDCRD